MKVQFSIVIAGGDSLRQKLRNTIEANPNLHMDLVRAFSNSIMLSLRLNEEDNIIIESFRANEVELQETPPDPEV